LVSDPIKDAPDVCSVINIYSMMFIQDDCMFLYVHMISKQVIALWGTRTIVFDVYMSDML